MSRSILIVEHETAALREDVDFLTGVGHQVESRTEATLAIAAARELKPDLVICDAVMPLLSGRELIRALRSFQETRATPVIFLASQAGPVDELRAILAGALAVWQRPFGESHVAELEALPEVWKSMERLGPNSRLLRLLEARMEARQAEGVMVANAGTPFEGKIGLEGGKIVSTAFGGLSGKEALGELLALEDATWRLDPSGAANSRMPSSPGAYQPRVLLVDDEENLRKLWTRTLTKEGFNVSTAENGAMGVERAKEGYFDLVITDLSMPVLDGWGLITALRGDPRTIEVPILVMSAVDDLREGLRAGRAGAHDYLPKTGHSDRMVEHVRTLTAPRRLAWSALERGEETQVELSAVGPFWLLRAAARTQATVVIEAVDTFGEYSLRCANGCLADARVVRPNSTDLDVRAVMTFGAVRGVRATLRPWNLGEDSAGPPIENVVEAAQLKLSDAANRLMTELVAATEHFEINPELYTLLLAHGGEQDVRIVRALFEQRVTPSSLPKTLNLKPAMVRQRLIDLLRRGVLLVPESSPASP